MLSHNNGGTCMQHRLHSLVDRGIECNPGDVCMLTIKLLLKISLGQIQKCLLFYPFYILDNNIKKLLVQV